jgi:hypothetical protein
MTVLQNSRRGENIIVPDVRLSLVSVMLAVPDAPAAIAWYKRALGATELRAVKAGAGVNRELT